MNRTATTAARGLALAAAALALAAADPAQPPASSTGPAATRPGSPAAACAEAAARILAASAEKNGAFERLTELCDDIGPRLCGSPGLERAIDWALAALRRDGHENVRAEPVQVPHWERGPESLVMLSPRAAPLAMLGLGGSVGTPPDGITAEVISVPDEAALARLGDGVRGKIVLFNYAMPPYDPQRGPGYGTAVRFRTLGARWAAAYGAVACLVRSTTARSLRSPHTGMMSYEGVTTRIPAASVSLEDAELLTRFSQRGAPATVRLSMAARDLGMVASANVVAELRGRARPEEIVLLSAHLDSWDVGQGAHDDGAGCAAVLEALHLLRRLELRPRRTIRLVLWTGEEIGLFGAEQYVRNHTAELPRHVAAIEMDTGGFAPTGFGVDLADPARQKAVEQKLSEFVPLLAPLGATAIRPGFGGSDIGRLKPHGVPLFGLDVDLATYFDYHHSHADTLDKVDPALLRKDAAALAIMAYILAETPERLDSR